MERSIGRVLSSSECVHHINGLVDDDRIDNLEILDKSTHSKLHNSYLCGRRTKPQKQDIERPQQINEERREMVMLMWKNKEARV